MSKHLPVVPVKHTAGAPGDFVASGSPLVLPRALGRCGHARAAQCTTLYRVGIVRYAVQGQQRGAQERRRDEGAEDRAKEVARTAGGKAAGAWVTGGRGGGSKGGSVLCVLVERSVLRGTDVMDVSSAVARGNRH